MLEGITRNATWQEEETNIIHQGEQKVVITTYVLSEKLLFLKVFMRQIGIIHRMIVY